MQENKAERIHRKVWDSADKFLDELERGHQQESRLEPPLESHPRKDCRTGSMVEGFELEPSKGAE
jgi:hypothetical protein